MSSTTDGRRFSDDLPAHVRYLDDSIATVWHVQGPTHPAALAARARLEQRGYRVFPGSGPTLIQRTKKVSWAAVAASRSNITPQRIKWTTS